MIRPSEQVSPLVPESAMVLAAGLGMRMRPITDRLPKPLISIGGRTMLDRALDALDRVGVKRVVVNTHHLASRIDEHLRSRRQPGVVVSHEHRLLETGGGIAKALIHFNESVFFVVNGDIVWQDGARPAPIALASAWNASAMDALLLLHPVDRAVGYCGNGDFFIGAEGRIERRGSALSAPFLFAGLQILHPRLFTDHPVGAFSLNVLYDRAIAQRRLFGVIHDGGWCHVGTPADIALAEAFIRSTDQGPPLGSWAVPPPQ